MSEERDITQKTDWRERIGRLPGLRRFTPVGRRRLARLGIVALVLTVLVVIPGYIATQPQFLDRYADMQAEYDTWQTSVHAKVPCQSCHVPPGFVAQSKYDVKMLGEFYISLVFRSRQPDYLSRPTNAACSSCHIDLRTVSPSGDLNIPHRAHVDILSIECVSCHEYLVHETSPEGNHTPRMIACLECHDGEQAKDACSTCHTQKAAPDSHQAADWVVVHPDKQAEEDCESCHGWTDKWCAECHTRRPASHADKWRSTHRDKVEARRNCEVCHEGEFCVRCHGEVPTLNFDPELTLVE